jgi:hypothetical protein
MTVFSDPAPSVANVSLGLEIVTRYQSISFATMLPEPLAVPAAVGVTTA